MRHIVIIIIIQIFFVGAVFCSADDTTTQSAPSRHDRIYYFQHRVLPKWTHESEGEFYKSLLNGNYDILLETASKIVGEEFSNQISIKRHNDVKGVLLTFPTPVEPPECYFIFISKDDNKYRLFTYEKTADLFSTGNKGVIGEWSSEGKHKNLGPRKYEDAEHFIQDLKDLI